MPTGIATLQNFLKRGKEIEGTTVLGPWIRVPSKNGDRLVFQSLQGQPRHLLAQRRKPPRMRNLRDLAQEIVDDLEAPSNSSAESPRIYVLTV
jgi:hypothetical protein